MACRLLPVALLALSACAPIAAPPPAAPSSRADAIALAERLARAGEAASEAIARLQKAGFGCRRLAPHEFASFAAEPVTMTSCHIPTERTAEGYNLVYANLAIGAAGRIVEMHADSYPVVYRSLRRDAQGRIIVVRDEGRR